MQHPVLIARDPGVKRRYSWLLAAISGALALLLLTMPCGTSANSPGVGTVAQPTAVPGCELDLCGLLPANLGKKSAGANHCRADNPPGSPAGDTLTYIIEDKRSPMLAQGEVKNHSGVGRWKETSGYGDLTWEETPISDTDTHQIAFSRGQYYVYVHAGPNVTAGAKNTLQQIDQALQAQIAKPGCGPAGATPTPTDLDLILDHVEIVQVVQDEYNRVQLYSGKKTLVRVFVGVRGAATPVPNVNVELRIFEWHDEAGTLVPARNTPFTVPLFFQRGVLTTTVNFDLPDDMVVTALYPYEVKINPDRSIVESDYANNDVRSSVQFVEPYNLRIGYVRIGHTPPGSANVVWPLGPLQTYTSTLVNIYPIDERHLQYYEFPNTLVYTGTLTPGTNPVTGIDNKLALRYWLRERYDRLRHRRGDMAPDIVVGYLGWQGTGPTNVFTDAVGMAELGTYDGEPQSRGGPAPTPTIIVPRASDIGRVSWMVDYNGAGGLESSERVLAHELGHVLTLHHPGTNDTGLPGSHCWASTINDFPGYWPRGTGQIGEPGYNHLTQDVVLDTDYDVMNYCAANRTWISKFHYERLFEAMRRYNFNDPDLMPDLTLDDVLVSGSIRRDGSSGSLAPVYRNISSGQRSGGGNQGPDNAIRNTQYSASLSAGAGLHSPASRQGQGNNCLRFTGSGGSTVLEHCFGVSFFEEETGQQLDVAGFSLRLPYPQGATGVVLVSNGKELDRRTPGSNAPQLTITSPKGGDTWEGSRTVTWTASDQDGDALTYEVHYSPTGGDDWFPLELGLQDTQYTINTADVAGGDKVHLRVFASDGFNTAQADVGPIKIPNSPPWEPPARPVSNAPQTTPAKSGSGPDALLLTILGLGLAFVVGAIIVATVAITRRSRAGQVPAGYSQPNVPPYSPQRPHVPPPPPAPQVQTQFPTPPTSLRTANPVIEANFRWSEQEYGRLRGELAAGRLHPQQYHEMLKRLAVRDAQGRSWMLDAQSGRWLVYDGRAWVWADPYGQG